MFQLITFVFLILLFCLSKFMFAGLDEIHELQSDVTATEKHLQQEEFIGNAKLGPQVFRLKRAELDCWYQQNSTSNIYVYFKVLLDQGLLVFDLDYPNDSIVSGCDEECLRKFQGGSSLMAHDTKHRSTRDKHCKRIIFQAPNSVETVRYRVNSNQENYVVCKGFNDDQTPLSFMSTVDSRMAAHKRLEFYPFSFCCERFPQSDAFESELDDQTLLSISQLVFKTLKEKPGLRGSEHKKWPSPIRSGNVEIVNDDG